MPSAIKEWRAAAIIAKTEDELRKRLVRCQLLVQAEIRKSINRGNSTGKFPSAEGEPPKKVSARLFRSIVALPLEQDGEELIAKVASNDDIGKVRRLELGFHGRDKLGRNISQGARPFMRPGIQNNRTRIVKILKGESK